MIRPTIYIITILVTALFFAGDLYAETAKVITKENAIRGDCKFFSPVKARVSYGDSLETISKEGDWYRVKYKNIKGCIHKSAVEEKSFKLINLSGFQSQSASKDEVSLAGKGFNPKVESAYKKKHPKLDFNAVDRIVEYKISEEGVQKFIRDGGLNLP